MGKTTPEQVHLEVPVCYSRYTLEKATLEHLKMSVAMDKKDHNTAGV